MTISVIALHAYVKSVKRSELQNDTCQQVEVCRVTVRLLLEHYGWTGHMLHTVSACKRWVITITLEPSKRCSGTCSKLFHSSQHIPHGDHGTPPTANAKMLEPSKQCIDTCSNPFQDKAIKSLTCPTRYYIQCRPPVKRSTTLAAALQDNSELPASKSP